ncbi:hypothetical protein Kim5_PC00248 (plasmid) [Rhizobium sp. Kim5]|nr:hypothetical protein Kim5_PC00248 [Rhizobium sp. Kim5]
MNNGQKRDATMNSTRRMNIALPVESAKHVEHWLRTQVGATYDAHKADPSKAKPLAEVWKRLEARMDEIDQEQR